MKEKERGRKEGKETVVTKNEHSYLYLASKYLAFADISFLAAKKENATA